MASTVWLSILAKKGALVVRPRTIVPCEWTDTFNSLLCKLGVEDEIIERTIISNNDKFLDPTHIVPLTAPLSLCDQFKCNFVCFHCGSPEETLVTDDEIVELKKQYAVARPICFLCKSDGKKVFTSHPSTWPRKGKSIANQAAAAFLYLLLFICYCASFI